MCEIIQIENIISNYLVLNEKETDVSFETLYRFKRLIEKKFVDKNKFIVVDFSSSAIINAANINSELFSLKNDHFFYHRNDNKTLLKSENDQYFNAKLPFNIKNEYLSVFSEVNDEL
ncbi:MAG: hypothetical protein EHM93_03465 [Bacteroidales bacterium]|nr:MAG: hypothetical protein EHM93_03465 [Bacteroidales bacterium]